MEILLILIISLVLYVADEYSKKRQRQDPDALRRYLAVGNRERSPWQVYSGVAVAVIAGGAPFSAWGNSWMFGSVVAALSFVVYLEQTQYPRLVITLGPDIAKIVYGIWGTVIVSIDEKIQFLLDGKRLKIIDQWSNERIVLACQDFPNVDFPALRQWFLDLQQDKSASVLRRGAAIIGMREVEGILDLCSPKEAQSFWTVILCLWIGILLMGIKKSSIFGG